ncbi:MAG: M23 family metallopeptidase [Tatlockia sp.]|nr:M23 family metallopeptidase [Tatlockia sp.]
MKLNKILIFFMNLSSFLIPTGTVFADELNINPSITINVYDVPRPVVALNKAYLVYEIYLTNFMAGPATLTSLEAIGGNKQSMLKTDELRNSIQTFNPNNKKIPLIFESGESKIIYMWLPFEQLTEVPVKLNHDFHFSYLKGNNYKLSSEVNVDKAPPAIISPPLRGSNWLIGNGLSNSSIHRRAAVYFNGRPYFSERFAIDFVQVDTSSLTFKGDETKNSSYHCYNQDLLAVADGKVVMTKDGIPENIPHSGKLAEPLSLENIAGNNIILDLGNGKFAFYAHLIPGSLKVKVGDQVTAGQVIGKLGNSGNSSEPHLHFHMVDKASALAANGIPYGFDHFNLRPTKLVGDRIEFLKNPAMHYSNQLPLENVVIDFAN